MTSPAKVHDPLYNFETHFPERLSRLQLQNELSSSFRRQKRNKRSGARYKTQPVTFDEIQEVDEEPQPEEAKDDGLKGKFKAFSRSMDGLLPKIPGSGSPRSSSRRHSGHPPAIEEKVDLESRLAEAAATSIAVSSVAASGAQERLKQGAESEVKPKATLSPQEVAGPSDGSSPPVPVPSPNTAPRRQKITAKAKKRQKAVEDGGGKET